MKKDWKLLAIGIPALIVMLPVVVAGILYQSVRVYFVLGREVGSLLHKTLVDKLEAK